MKILHLISGSLSGGAAKGALRLHLGLLELGVDSYIAGCNFDNENIKNLYDTSGFISTLKLRVNIKLNLLKLIKYNRPKLFSIGNDLFSVFNNIEFNDFDLIHLHFINNSISINEIEKLGMNNKVVWTLRDMWPFTGGCHYSLQCTNYINKCGNCFQLTSNKTYDLSHKQFIKKHNAFNNIFPVAISNWLQTNAEKANMFTNPVQTIYNSVDTQVFRKLNSQKVTLLKKKYFNLEKPILAIGAQNITDFYKGGEHLKAFIGNYKEHYQFAFFGEGIDSLINGISNLTYHNFGFIDEEELANVFNLSDLFLMFSIQEAFGKTIIEALSCETPVMVLPGSAPEEIISSLPKECGFVWDGVTEPLVKINEYVNSASNFPIELINDMFSQSNIAKQYLAKYHKVI